MAFKVYPSPGYAGRRLSDQNPDFSVDSSTYLCRLHFFFKKTGYRESTMLFAASMVLSPIFYWMKCFISLLGGRYFGEHVPKKGEVITLIFVTKDTTTANRFLDFVPSYFSVFIPLKKQNM